MHYLYLVIAIVAEVTATTALKAVDGFSKPLPIVICLLGYGCALSFLYVTLQSMKVGLAYAVWTGAGMVLITVMAFLVHKQRVDLPAIFGIGLIIAGVVLIYAYSDVEIHSEAEKTSEVNGQ